MTEAEWLACTDPSPMLEFLEGKASGRKVSLFAVACCRRIWDLFNDERSRKAVEVAELAIEGQATIAQRADAVQKAESASEIPLPSEFQSDDVFNFQKRIWASSAAFDTAILDLLTVSGRTPGAVMVAGFVSSNAAQARNNDGERSAQAALLRDIFGNPFRPVTVDPTWLIPTVTFLARMIYEDRSFDQMPELADSLEAAGCTNDDILAHCRMGDHVRGCWVVELILGKE